jgi:formate C-acetyltransferase
VGFKGIKEQIMHALERLEHSDQDADKKRAYYQALLTTANAVIVFANRHAEEAERLASDCQDATRKAELEAIAEICRRVPEHPAATYHEALQSFWFVHLALNLESNSYAISPGRFCQYIYPFYKQDLDKGVLTRAQGQELLNCLWLKFAELTVAKEGGTAKASNTYADFQNLNVGGLKADGSDGTNDISYMCLEAQMDLLLPQPQLSCLISAKTPHEFLLKASELARMGTGMPAMFNADETVLALTEKGKSLKDARSGGINGCVEITAQGCDNMASSGYVNLVMCLMLALNNGRNLQTGTQFGPQTGNPEDFSSIEDLWSAFEKQVHAMVDIKQQYDNAARKAFAEVCPVLVTSLVVDDCIEKGRDFHQGGARYNSPMMCGVGTGTVADSVAAIERHVFQDNTFSLTEVVVALQVNFEGHDEMRELFWNKTPKFGNNDLGVDKNAARLVEMFSDVLNRFTNAESEKYAANMIPTTAHLPFGELTGATPDGRLAEEPLSEGVSPVQGKDSSGPLAVLTSIARIDHARTAGTLLNMKFSPDSLKGDVALRKFANMIRTYFDMGGHHIQFNVVSRETLLDAQAKPEDYRSLLIRVAGYSDYFVMLSKDVQDEVISRNEH